MKKKQLELLNFKDYLRTCYEEIEPDLIGELNDLRAKLIKISEIKTQNLFGELVEMPIDEGTYISLFENSIEKINEIDKKKGRLICTDEREGLCEAFRQMGEIVGFVCVEECIHWSLDW